MLKRHWFLVPSSTPSPLFFEGEKRDLVTDYFLNSLADQNVLFDRFSQPHGCSLGRKWWNTSVVIVTCFSLYMFLFEDKRPHGEDYPEWLHHDLWPDPNWDNPLPEAPQTCGPGEADGLYFHGRPQTTERSYLQDSTKALWPTSPILCILIEVSSG